MPLHFLIFCPLHFYFSYPCRVAGAKESYVFFLYLVAFEIVIAGFLTGGCGTGSNTIRYCCSIGTESRPPCSLSCTSCHSTGERSTSVRTCLIKQIRILSKSNSEFSFYLHFLSIMRVVSVYLCISRALSTGQTTGKLSQKTYRKCTYFVVLMLM